MGNAKLEGVTRQLVDKAVDGDPRVMQQLLAEIHKNEARAELEASGPSLGEADREVLEALYVHLWREAVPGKAGKPASAKLAHRTG